jgi:hypothetical protein
VIRRYNYTGRKAINRSDANMRIEDGPLRFHAALALDNYGLLPDAKVFVEAYRQTNWMRFDFGTVGAVKAPGDLRLSEFDTREGILFRVRVTATANPEGRLLAEADQISPVHIKETGEETREPLLPIKPADLGEEVFRVDFSDRPILLINNQFGDWRALARSPFFVCMALPQTLREILTFFASRATSKPRTLRTGERGGCGSLRPCPAAPSLRRKRTRTASTIGSMEPWPRSRGCTG